MTARSILTILFVFYFSQVNAQRRPSAAAKTDSVKGAVIEVIQSYKPELRQAPKPDIDPAMPPADTSRPVFTYEVPQQTLSYTYSSFPIRPLALGRDTVPLAFSDYAKLGLGNLSTLVFDLGIGRFRGDDYKTAIHLNHATRAGRIANQKAMTTGLTASGTLYRNNMAHSAFVDIDRRQYHYYGYDHEVYKYDAESVRQRFTDINFGFSTQNEGEGFMGVDYKPSIAFSLYSDRYDAAEQSVDLNVPLSYVVDSGFQLNMGLHLLYTRYAHNTLDIRRQNNILQLTPGVHFRNNVVTAYAGLYPTFGKNGTAYLLPELRLQHRLTGLDLLLEIGYKASLRQNTYEQLSRRNPFMVNYYNNAHQMMQTRSDEAYISGKTTFGTHLIVEAKAGWKNWNNLPLYLNDTAGDMKQFLLVYDDVSAIFLEGTVRYQVANTFSVGLSPALYNFHKRSETHVWHEPGIKLTADLLIKPIENLTVTGYLSFMDELYAIKKNNATEKLSPVIDLGGAAEYAFTDRISAFVQVNNLLNNKYQRWYGYEAFGFNVFGGLRVKF